jgi:prophage antirepressor-like protein
MFPHPTVVNPNLSRLTMNIVKFFEKSEIRFVDHPKGKYGFGIVADDLAEVLGHSNSRMMSEPIKEKWRENLEN